ALQVAVPDCMLLIYCSSEYIVHLFCYWAMDNVNRSWPCTHGDVLHTTVRLHYVCPPL
ncbi:hypothetical protein B0H10DRAFT_1805550, partial [Mycena sp. CBHHK59/15]